jgi:ribosomal protein S27AE
MKLLKKKTPRDKESSPVLGSYLTTKECPKCGAKLYHELLGGLTRYICGKCGYFGPVALEPLKSKKKDKKKFEKAVRNMRKFMKSRPKKK